MIVRNDWVLLTLAILAGYIALALWFASPGRVERRLAKNQEKLDPGLGNQDRLQAKINSDKKLLRNWI